MFRFFTSRIGTDIFAFVPNRVIINVATDEYTFIITIVIMNTGRLKNDARTEFSTERATATAMQTSAESNISSVCLQTSPPTMALISIFEPSDRSNEPDEKMNVAPVATSATRQASETTPCSPIARS